MLTSSRGSLLNAQRFRKSALRSICEKSEITEKSELVNDEKENGESRLPSEADSSNVVDGSGAAAVRETSEMVKSRADVKSGVTDETPVVKVSTIGELKRVNWGMMREHAVSVPYEMNTMSSSSASDNHRPKLTSSESDTALVSRDRLGDDESSQRRGRWNDNAFRKFLETRECDPEAVLHDLGFAGDSEQSSLADRLPIRFLMQPSQAAGIDVLRFIREHSDLAMFSNELADVNTYLRTLRTRGPPPSRVHFTQGDDGPPTTADSNLLSRMHSATLVDQTESRASILRRFTGAQKQTTSSSCNSTTSGNAFVKSSLSGNEPSCNGAH